MVMFDQSPMDRKQNSLPAPVESSVHKLKGKALREWWQFGKKQGIKSKRSYSGGSCVHSHFSVLRSTLLSRGWAVIHRVAESLLTPTH